MKIREMLFLMAYFMAFSPKDSFAGQKIFRSNSKQWYQTERAELISTLSKYLGQETSKRVNGLQGLIVPHAGYIYSGKTAASAYKGLNGQRFDTVIIIGPSHKHYLKNRAVILNSNSYQTTRGKSSVNHDLLKSIPKNSYFLKSDSYFIGEHSIDNQLPFIQHLFPRAKILPIILGHFDRENLQKLAQILKPLISSKSLIVVSSDFTHFGPRFDYVPFKSDIKNNLKKLDLEAAELINKRDIEGFWKYKERTRNTICGFFPIALLLELLPKSSTGKLTEYKTSGEITGNYSNSVSYMAFTFQGEKNVSLATISDEEKKGLLLFARERIKNYLQDGKKLSPSDLKLKPSRSYEQKTGGFVTLHKNGELRGCIGEIFPTRSLIDVVGDRAIDAAVNDPRFPSLKLEELKDTHIEISILTPPTKADSYKDIELGKHGVVLQNGSRSSVFLPQVALEQGWDVETTLKHLSLKAGLGPDEWKDKNTTFELFEAIVFSEK